MKKVMSLLLSVLIAAMMVMPVMADIAVSEPPARSAAPFLIIGVLIIAAAIILFVLISKKR